MRSTTSSDVVETPPPSGRRAAAYRSGARLLLAAAAVLHVALAVGLHWAGRAQVAPGLIDRDGIMDTFAHDSYEYQGGAVRLAEVLREDGVAAWAAESQPLHVRLISIQFALLGSLSGYGPLSAEPFNLLCYLAVVGLTLLLGREVGGGRAGLLAAGAVALWPTFLLHTLQLLKDPLFIAGTLALALCVTTWLTRDYGRAGAAAAVALVGATVLLVLLIRFNFAVVIFALVLAGAALLVVRQIHERRLLHWNMAAPALILSAGALLLLPVLLLRPPAAQRFKQYPSDGGGRPKAAVSAGERVTAVVTYVPRVATGEGRVGRLKAAADRAAHRLGGVRSRFSASYTEAGSGFDRGVRFDDLKSLIRYLPRAFAVGWWAPFPNTWVAAGRRVGSAGKLLSGAETLFMYVVELLALAAVLRPPRRLASWLLLAVTAFGVTALGLVVPNIGALYRFRYAFWVLLIVLGAKGLESLLASGRRRLRAGAACAALACLLAGNGACSSNARPNDVTGVTATAATAGGRADALGFTLVNFTGTALKAVYVSPSDSGGWEENLLGAGELADGESVEIRFSPEERSAAWDVRVEAVDEHFAEWKGLRLGNVSRITLLLDVIGERVVVAEVE
ncbi:MAG TPA: hypothetical protein VF591_19225 [Pyrinomonadaceae bacterium]|jgi:hypothetical protein